LPSSRRAPNITFDLCRQSASIVLKTKDIAKNFGEKKVLHDVCFEIERGEKVAFVGANGIGKSTLLEIITSNQTASKGTFEWGFEAHAAYFPQDHAREVFGNINLLDWLGQFDSKATRETLQKVLARSLFSGDDVLKPVGVLSGGETARLILAKMMLIKHNVLIFDEPTNHLDMESIEALIKAIENYTGTVLFVSHNRYFVEKLAKRVIEMTPDGIKDFKCTYAEYVEKRDLDHLDITKAMRLSSEKPAKETPKNHEEERRKERHKASLTKRLDTIEAKCQKIELALKKIEETFSDESFYKTKPKVEQERLINEKHSLETEYHLLTQEWETVSEELLA
jgi:ABC-type multidrug transport system ATPase subunit